VLVDLIQYYTVVSPPFKWTWTSSRIIIRRNPWLLTISQTAPTSQN